MSQSVTIHDALLQVAILVKEGDNRRAKREMRELLNVADGASLALISRCASTLEHFPHRIAVEKLRNAWRRTADEDQRALIVACAPEQDNGQYRPETEPAAPSRYGRDNYRAPRNSRRSYDPTRRKAQRTQRQARQEAAAVRYFSERGGVAEGQQLKDRDDRAQDVQVYASGLDYDKAGVPDTRGLPCVACWLERAAADVATDRVRAGHGDDGLCGDCRESGRPGIPELPAGHTRAEAIEARCAFIAERAGTSARGILRREWKRYADPRERATVAAWVQAHPLPEPAAPSEPPAEETASAETAAPVTAAVDGACEQCRGIRQVRHGLCLDCRQLDSAPLLSAVPSAAADEAEVEPAPLAA
jgi:hypothetical protein